jgi:hypothetical protein
LPSPALAGRLERRSLRRPAQEAAYARRALEAAGADPVVLANAALVLKDCDDIGTMMALVDRAPALNPSFARGW